MSTLQLFPGMHDTRRLTPAIGQNNTRLVIEDNSGRKEILHSSYIFNPTLIAKGRNLFSYNLGFERSVKGGIYHYDLKKPVLSASYMGGLTDEATAGGYVKADELQILLGVKTIHAFPSSTVDLDMVVSTSDLGEQDVGAKMTWSEIPDKHSDLRLQSRLTMEYLSKIFNAVNTSLPAQSNALNTQIGGAYMSRRSQCLLEEYQVDAPLTRKWGKYTTTTASLRRYGSNQHKTQTEFLFELHFNFSKGANSFYFSKEMESNTLVSRCDNERSSASAGAYGFASTKLSPDQLQYQGGVGYVGNQGLAEISHTQVEINQHDDRVVQKQQTAFHLQSTLVLANTTFALFRPVTQNFDIIKGK